MAKNVGKVFESSIKNSMPDYALLIRLPDPPQAFTKRSDTKFSNKNPFDYICFDTISRILYCLELKTTSGKSISFEDINSDEVQNRIIHKHQILGLQNFSKYQNVRAGFLFNFRHYEDNKEKYFETTYYQSINDFLNMTLKINKKSFDEINLIQNNAVTISGAKKRTRFHWNMDDFFKNMNE